MGGGLLRWRGQAGPTVNVMTALYRAGLTDLIDLTFENIRCGTDRQ
jgi:hypothetical protein